MIRAIRDVLGPGLALPLLVTRVGANHADDAFAANYFAVFAKLLNRCANFHKYLLKRFFFDEDAAFGQITGRQFQLHFVPDVDSGQIEPRLANHKSQQPMPIGKFDSIRFVR
jgi:hypothetical protein